MLENSDLSKRPESEDPDPTSEKITPGDHYDFSGDFRGAVINVKSTIIGNAEVKDIENLPPEPGHPPYQGLKYFDEDDADWFFGREQLTARLIGRLSQTRFLAVIGASGSGKSSLVRAGVIPSLKSGRQLADGSLPPSGSVHWFYRVFRPGSRPLDALAVSLSSADTTPDQITGLRDQIAADPKSLVPAVQSLLAQEKSPHLLLVIDQFEEIFTRAQSSEERTAFIDALISASSTRDHQPISFLICLRADFYPQLAQHDALREMASQHQEFIGSMSRNELLEAIVAPLNQGNWKIQEGLVTVILDDIGHEPGALPLLSHTLLETWKHRRARTLTVSGYGESGGVKGSIRETAETVFKQQLTPEQQSIAKMIFLRLAEISEDVEDLRTHSRRAAFSELITHSADELSVRTVIDILADARLVTTGTIEPGSKRIVEVAHEALIREWPRLQEWLQKDRQGRVVHQQVTRDANNWLKLERDPGVLYRGLRLIQAIEWLQSNKDLSTPIEQEFLEVSQKVDSQERDQKRRLSEAVWTQSLLVIIVGWSLLGTTINSIPWKAVSIFAIFGWARGWAKELLVSLTLIFALTLNHVLRRYVPFFQYFPETEATLFWLRTLTIILFLLLGYGVTRKFSYLWSDPRREDWQTRFFGSVTGALNGYLAISSILYYLYVAGNPVPNIISNTTEPGLTQTINQMMLYMAPQLLGEPGIYFALVLSAVFVLVTVVQFPKIRSIFRWRFQSK